MSNDDRYLSRPPDKLRRRISVQDSPDAEKGGIYGIIGTVSLILAIGTPIALLHDDRAAEAAVMGVMFAITAVVALAISVSLLRGTVMVERQPGSHEFSEDKQARGLYDRINAVTKHSTAGWDDDLWQAFFTIGKLLDEKKALNSVTLAQELHDEIDVLIAELDDMIVARKALVDQRRRLGMELTVPGTEAQRIEAGVAEEMEELAMRPLLRQRIAEIKSEGPGELT